MRKLIHSTHTEEPMRIPTNVDELARDYGHPYMTEEEQRQFAALVQSIRAAPEATAPPEAAP